MVAAVATLDPEVAARIRDSFALQGAMAHLGAVIAEMGVGRVAIALPWRPQLTQQDGFFHAGIVTTICDSACGYAALTLMPADARVLTVELKLNLVDPAHGERLVATGRVEKSGRTLSVTRGEVVAERGGERTTVALMQATMICLRPRE
jgi:uncharacterized protein (TIGR00369 family)